MERTLFILFLCAAGFYQARAQKGLPFNLKELSVQIPIELPNLERDTVSQKDDILTYHITGMEIKDTVSFEMHAVTNTDKSTPWLVFGELLNAYKTGDIEAVKALYTKSSQSRISSVLANQEARDNYLALVKVQTSIHPYFALEYDNGVIIMAETAPGTVERFRFEKVLNKYYLAVYEEKNQPVINNVFAYYYYRPQPYIKPQLVQGVDSVKMDESPTVTIRLKKTGDWVSVFIPSRGYAVNIYAKDNGTNDGDPEAGIVKIPFYGSSFPRGPHEVEVVESNFRPMLISNSMINAGLKFNVKIKE